MPLRGHRPDGGVASGLRLAGDRRASSGAPQIIESSLAGPGWRWGVDLWVHPAEPCGAVTSRQGRGAP